MYTCSGADISPPLEWGNPPEGTQSFALLCVDIDAGEWAHWTLYNLPAEMRSLPEDVPKKARVPGGGLQGLNGTMQLGYKGPCPPSGNHRYVFTLYALDTALDVGEKPQLATVREAMEGHILDEAELMGVYP